MKSEQVNQERQLWEERNAIQKKYEDKVKVAVTRANMIGASLSKHEAAMISDAFKKELLKFDLERVLPAWDGLISKQQASLEARGVPMMFPTSSQTHQEGQQKVIQVLEGIVGPGSRS
jgi:hypothetical protein